MSRASNANLQDKDIRKLQILDKRYSKAVGNPKELYIFVYPSGIKTFYIKHKKTSIKLHNFREGIYSVAEARRDAIDLLHRLINGLDLKENKDKYLFKSLFERYIAQKRKKGLQESYITKVELIVKKYIYPKFANTDVKNISYTNLLEILNVIFRPNEIQSSRLETLHRLINHISNTFELALKDRYIEYNPINSLHNEFPTVHKFKIIHQLDTRLPALTDDNKIKEFIQELKADSKMALQTKRAVYIQILSANRPINTVSAKWRDIDLEKGIWTISAKEMKTSVEHIIALNSQMIKVFKEQRLFCDETLSPYVFPSLESKSGHICVETISKAIRYVNNKNYSGLITSHGFRATFRTICSKNKAELLKLGITDEVIESVLAHKESNKVKYAYEREKATIEQKAKLMQWYGDYLDRLESLFD
jgi:integrase